jgi:hypothetical protein
VIEYRRHGTNMSGDPGLMLEQVVRVLKEERAFVEHDRDLRAAYDDGLRFYREHFGGQLAEELESNFRRGDWRRAGRDAIRLLRYYPEGIWRRESAKVRR